MNRLGASLGICAVLVALLATQTTATAPKAQASSASSTTKLLWADSFSGKKGATFDHSAWNAETGNSNGGWGNKELEYYTPDAAKLTGTGKLAITAAKAPAGLDCWTVADCKYTSARLNTAGKVTLTTGKVSIRVKLPKGVGLWPAFWMLGASGPWPGNGEIDVMEWIGSAPHVIGATVHGPSSANLYGYSVNKLTTLPKDGKYHRYTMKKATNDLKFYLDGKLYAHITPKDLPVGAKWVYNKSEYLVLNLAVGGTFPGAPTSKTAFPAKLLVDYVRVWGTGTAPKK
jgi:beta-glucanase (GH16 family)